MAEQKAKSRGRPLGGATRRLYRLMLARQAGGYPPATIRELARLDGVTLTSAAQRINSLRRRGLASDLRAGVTSASHSGGRYPFDERCGSRTIRAEGTLLILPNGDLQALTPEEADAMLASIPQYI